MGLGKTAQAIVAMDHILEHSELTCSDKPKAPVGLIVCPKTTGEEGGGEFTLRYIESFLHTIYT